MIFEIRAAALLIGTALGAYTDARTGLILDKITYPMIALGILLNLAEWNLEAFAVPAAVFAIGFALYWLGKIGGGDVKLFTGIALLLPLYNGRVFIVHALLGAALLSMVFYSVYFVARYWRKGIRLQENREGITRALVLGAIIAAYMYYMTAMGFLTGTVPVMLAVVMGFALLFLALEKGIKKNFFLKEIALEKLEEDEVVATEFLEHGLKEKLGLGFKGIIGNREVEKLRELGVKSIPVYRSMPPFGPFIFLGVAAALFFPELFGFLIV